MRTAAYLFRANRPLLHQSKQMQVATADRQRVVTAFQMNQAGFVFIATAVANCSEVDHDRAVYSHKFRTVESVCEISDRCTGVLPRWQTPPSYDQEAVVDTRETRMLRQWPRSSGWVSKAGSSGSIHTQGCFRQTHRCATRESPDVSSSEPAFSEMNSPAVESRW